MYSDTPAARAVQTALHELSAEMAALPAEGLFRTFATVEQVAKRAAVGETTARRYLEELSGFRGYTTRQFPRGRRGYRYTPTETVR